VKGKKGWLPIKANENIQSKALFSLVAWSLSFSKKISLSFHSTEKEGYNHCHEFVTFTETFNSVSEA
jgi:hypothetical protein